MRRGQRGYTLVEIMAAVLVMTIGATGILAMQGASVRSNQDANETSIAINFATTWVERVKRDASRYWRETGTTPLGLAKYVKVADFYVPVTTAKPELESFGADYYGFDTFNEADIRYCVNLRGTVAHMYNPLNPAAPDITQHINAVRVDVRVWWYRWGPDADRTIGPRCTSTAGVLSAAQVADPRIRKHYLSTVVTWRKWP